MSEHARAGIKEDFWYANVSSSHTSLLRRIYSLYCSIFIPEPEKEKKKSTRGPNRAKGKTDIPLFRARDLFFFDEKKKKSQGVSEKWDSIMSPEEQQPWYDLEDEKRNEYIFNMEPGFKKNLAIDRNRKDGHFYLDRKRK